jgi:hypothetical protein
MYFEYRAPYRFSERLALRFPYSIIGTQHGSICCTICNSDRIPNRLSNRASIFCHCYTRANPRSQLSTNYISDNQSDKFAICFSDYGRTYNLSYYFTEHKSNPSSLRFTHSFSDRCSNGFANSFSKRVSNSITVCDPKCVSEWKLYSQLFPHRLPYQEHVSVSHTYGFSFRIPDWRADGKPN